MNMEQNTKYAARKTRSRGGSLHVTDEPRLVRARIWVHPWFNGGLLYSMCATVAQVPTSTCRRKSWQDMRFQWPAGGRLSYLMHPPHTRLTDPSHWALLLETKLYLAMRDEWRRRYWVGTCVHTKQCCCCCHVSSHLQRSIQCHVSDILTHGGDGALLANLQLREVWNVPEHFNATLST